MADISNSVTTTATLTAVPDVPRLVLVSSLTPVCAFLIPSLSTKLYDVPIRLAKGLFGSFQIKSGHIQVNKIQFGFDFVSVHFRFALISSWLIFYLINFSCKEKQIL